MDDGTSIRFDSLQVGTSNNDYMLFGDEGITTNGLDGSDTIISGGDGDDTYILTLNNYLLKVA